VITVCAEHLRDTLEELKPLFDPHWRELAHDRDQVPLDPQYETYLAREALGEVLSVIARERGKIVAYFVGFVAPGLHYKTCLTLTMDIFWIHPDYRAEDSLGELEEQMLAWQLFAEVLKEARRRGVRRAFFGSKALHDASSLFEQLGMVKADVYYSRLLGD
jgi:hypothetical protein